MAQIAEMVPMFPARRGGVDPSRLGKSRGQ